MGTERRKEREREGEGGREIYSREEFLGENCLIPIAL